jgi:hypothetical protein
MNDNIKTTHDIYRKYYLLIEDKGTPLLGTLQKMEKEKWVSLPWLERVLLTYDTVEDVIKELQQEIGC